MFRILHKGHLYTFPTSYEIKGIGTDQSLPPPLDVDHVFFGPLFVTILSIIFGAFCRNGIAKFDANYIEAFKLQMVLPMEPQMSLLAGVLWQHSGPTPGACLGSVPPKHFQLEAARTATTLPTLEAAHVISEMGH